MWDKLRELGGQPAGTRQTSHDRLSTLLYEKNPFSTDEIKILISGLKESRGDFLSTQAELERSGCIRGIQEIKNALLQLGMNKKTDLESSELSNLAKTFLAEEINVAPREGPRESVLQKMSISGVSSGAYSANATLGKPVSKTRAKTPLKVSNSDVSKNDSGEI